MLRVLVGVPIVGGAAIIANRFRIRQQRLVADSLPANVSPDFYRWVQDHIASNGFASPALRPYWQTRDDTTWKVLDQHFGETMGALGFSKNGTPAATTGVSSVNIRPLKGSGYTAADFTAAGPARHVSVGGPSALCLAAFDALAPTTPAATGSSQPSPCFIGANYRDMAGVWAAMHIQPSASKSMHRADRGQGVAGLDAYSVPNLAYHGALDFVWPKSIVQAAHPDYFAVGTDYGAVIPDPLFFAKTGYRYHTDSKEHDSLEKQGKITHSMNTVALARSSLPLWSWLDRTAGGVPMVKQIGSKCLELDHKTWTSAPEDTVLDPAGFRKLETAITSRGGTVMNSRVTDIVIDTDAPNGGRPIGVVCVDDKGQKQLVNAATVYATFGARVQIKSLLPAHAANSTLVAPFAATGGSWMILVKGKEVKDILIYRNTHISPLSWHDEGNGNGYTLCRATDGAWVTSREGAGRNDVRHAAKVPVTVAKNLLPEHQIIPLAVTPCARPLSAVNRPQYVQVVPGCVISYGWGGVGLTQATGGALVVQHLRSPSTSSTSVVPATSPSFPDFPLAKHIGALEIKYC